MTVMTELPAEERRGGTDPDWDRTRPGEELPDKEAPELWDPPQDPRFALDDDDCGVDDRDAVPLYHSCGLPGCGGD
jgi:hypothetical protein